MLCATTAFAAIVVRQHSATIQPDLKILASDLNDEFNNLVTGVNTIDSTNVVAGSLTQTNVAATSTMISLNKRTGCKIRPASEPTGNAGSQLTQISIDPPCEIFMDGLRGFITATQSISLTSNLDTGLTPTSSTFYYIYATRNSSSLLFEFSANVPDITTARMQGTAATQTASRYIGTVRTIDPSSVATMTNVIANFVNDGNHYYWLQDGNVYPGSTNPSTGLLSTLTTTAANKTLTVPQHFKRALFQYRGYASAFPAGCTFNFSTGNDLPFSALVIATGNSNNIGVVPQWIKIATENSSTREIPSASMTNNVNCFLGDLKVIGWEEPYTLYQ